MSQPHVLSSFDGPVPAQPIEEIAGVLEAEFGLRGDLSVLPGEREQNLRLTTAGGSFTIKVGPVDARRVWDLQHAALRHLAEHPGGLRVPACVAAQDGREVVHLGHDHLVRVLRFVEGRPLRELPIGTVALFAVGAAVAKMQVALQGFFHPAAGRSIPWDARQAPALLDILDVVPESEASRLEALLTRFTTTTLPGLDALPAQVIHNDLNPDNLLVTDGTIGGVIDFGDMVHGPRVLDLAVAAAYQLAGRDDPASVLSDLVAGYETVSPLSGAERAVLVELTSIRLCQSILIGAWHAARHPNNADYLLVDATPARRALKALESVTWPVPPPPSRKLIDRRAAAIAPGLRLSYSSPLHLVSGRGVWVEDAAGRRYLDAYNNVVQVGHGHPRVAHALARQTALLNTNTRYLTDELVAYAEQLVGLLPDGLEVCYFTASGSEANDLAVRMARAVTGNHGVIVTEHAYHGSTSVTAAMSPEEWGERPFLPWLATVPPPAGSETVGAVNESVADLKAAGFGPAALVFDPVFSSDGIYDPAASYLDESVQAAREAGALFIADEVQAGLGRVGSRFWGFAAGTVVPDIVTLGKPLGNGHPMGAVITTRGIAEQFADRDYFFSTFGGNTVSAVVGSTVLDITLREGLAEQAEEVGAHVRSSIAGLGLEHVSHVRGAGLFIGVEVVDAAGNPDRDRATALVEGMKENGVLIGRTGPTHNVLKIRPPLVFGMEHADMLLEALSEVGASVATG